MAKTSGLGDGFLLAGYDLSGDIGSLDSISGSQATLDVTGIDKSAYERLGGLRDGHIEFTAFFNPASNQAHPRLSSLPTSDVIGTYLRGTTLANPCASLVAKQINYDGTRAADGAFTFKTSLQANGYGLEWGVQLTAGKRTDTGATNGTGVDLTTVSTAFGLQGYLHVTAFSGTDCTVKIQDSADNASFADVSGAAFTQVTSGPTSQRIAVSGTVRRYLRAVTVTTGGFSSITFTVQVTRNETSVVF